MESGEVTQMGREALIDTKVAIMSSGEGELR